MLNKLVENLQEQDLDICSALMPRLNSSLIPTPDKVAQDASCIQNLFFAGEAFQVVATICQNRDCLDPALPSNYLPLFLEYRPHLFQWIQFFLNQKYNPEFYRSLCTITISSLGPMGGIASTPVINRPEVAITAVNKVEEKAVVVEGRIEVRRRMNLSSSFDHRVVDGWDAASFIQEVKRLLETPALLFA